MPKPRSMQQQWRYEGIDVDVTQDDIDYATRNSSYHCAVANAVVRAIPGATHVLVDVQTVRYSLESDDKRYVYLTPAEAAAYVVAYDAGMEILPFRFRLTRPIWTGTRVHRSGGKYVAGMSHINIGGETKSATVRTRHGTNRLSVPAAIPPVLPGRTAHREYGLRGLPMNRIVRDWEPVQSTTQGG